MPESYFHRINRQTQTRMWLNNPIGTEIDPAIAAGAINCTTNPAYCARLIASEPGFIHGIIDKVIQTESDDGAAAEVVYRQASARIAEQFLPLFRASNGAHGFVTIQGDPKRDDDADYIVAEALRHRAAGPNVMAKIPVNQAGLIAIERLAQMDVPICATEIFGIAQAISVDTAYRRAVTRIGRRPSLFVTHITGIFDRYMNDYVKRNGIQISPEVLDQAGWAVAHEQYRVSKQQGHFGLMLGGGALHTRHFTEMVGGDMHVTLNWNISRALIDADSPIVSRINEPAPAAVVAELSAKLPAFRQAMNPDGLMEEEYKDYGPLVMFRNMFLEGYGQLVDEVAKRRTLVGVR
jgi:transaldolase